MPISIHFLGVLCDKSNTLRISNCECVANDLTVLCKVPKLLFLMQSGSHHRMINNYLRQTDPSSTRVCHFFFVRNSRFHIRSFGVRVPEIITQFNILRPLSKFARFLVACGWCLVLAVTLIRIIIPEIDWSAPWTHKNTREIVEIKRHHDVIIDVPLKRDLAWPNMSKFTFCCSILLSWDGVWFLRGRRRCD